MLVRLAYSLEPRRVQQVVLRLPEGATVLQALVALREQHPQLAVRLVSLIAAGGLGLHGRRAHNAHMLHDDWRLDVVRPLASTPQQARRQRFEAQGARAAGLFAHRRPGAKPGY
ncbi:MAG: RnfH family protein [Ottowia sp.]|nr:RnfH family protein [Ottowia sp.]